MKTTEQPTTTQQIETLNFIQFSRPSIISFNKSLHQGTTFTEKPILLKVEIELKNNNKPFEAEKLILECIEKTLISKITGINDILYAGSYMSPRMKSFYFYSGQKNDLAKSISEINEDFPNYKFVFYFLNDNGETYKKFLHKVYEDVKFQFLFKELEQAGINLTFDVSHLISFTRKKDRDLFRNQMKPLRVEVVEDVSISGSRRYMARMTISEKIDWDSLHITVSQIKRLIANYRGIYIEYEIKKEVLERLKPLLGNFN